MQYLQEIRHLCYCKRSIAGLGQKRHLLSEFVLFHVVWNNKHRVWCSHSGSPASAVSPSFSPSFPHSPPLFRRCCSTWPSLQMSTGTGQLFSIGQAPHPSFTHAHWYSGAAAPLSCLSVACFHNLSAFGINPNRFKMLDLLGKDGVEDITVFFSNGNQ